MSKRERLCQAQCTKCNNFKLLVFRKSIFRMICHHHPTNKCLGSMSNVEKVSPVQSDDKSHKKT
eukprot:6156498-Amphidinium_carterae.1